MLHNRTTGLMKSYTYMNFIFFLLQEKKKRQEIPYLNENENSQLRDLNSVFRNNHRNKY